MLSQVENGERLQDTTPCTLHITSGITTLKGNNGAPYRYSTFPPVPHLLFVIPRLSVRFVGEALSPP